MPRDSLPKQAVVVVNAHSRKGEEAFEQVCDKLAERGVELIAQHAVDDPDEMRPIVRQAIADKVPMVIVGGGDGSLSTTVDEFLGSETVFAILPLGTANSFARTLGVPLDLDGAIDVIASGRRKRIDLGAIDGDYFANAAAMGLSPLIAETVPHNLKRYLGMFGYLIWAIRVAFKFRPFRLHVDDGRKLHKVWATEARIANGSHHGGVELVENAELTSGEIIVQAVTGRSLFGLAWSWFATLFKLRAREQTVTEFHGRELRIMARPAQKISVDGELSARTPVMVDGRPRRDLGRGAAGGAARRRSVRDCLSRSSAARKRSASADFSSWSERAFSTASGLARSAKAGLASRAARLSRSFSAASAAFDSRAFSASRSMCSASGKAMVAPSTDDLRRARRNGRRRSLAGPSFAIRASVADWALIRSTTHPRRRSRKGSSVALHGMLSSARMARDFATRARSASRCRP